MTAQDKILYVANKLGLTSLKDMQASTGAVYDCDSENSGQIFTSAARHVNPAVTNLNTNQFEVNEALLVETIGFYCNDTEESTGNVRNFQQVYGSNAVIIFDLIIGNKRVMTQTPVFGAGGPYAFANNAVDSLNGFVAPRNQVYLEGAGILIPPQIQWSVEYRIFNVVTGAVIPFDGDEMNLGCYLFGTRVLLNFNTSI